MGWEIWNLREWPDRLEQAAAWFHEKWGIPLAAYRESMLDCVEGKGPVPQWYVAVKAGAILGGLGVDTLYLLTDHTSFYERYGWEFFCMAQGDGEAEPSRMYVRRRPK